MVDTLGNKKTDRKTKTHYEITCDELEYEKTSNNTQKNAENVKLETRRESKRHEGILTRLHLQTQFLYSKNKLCLDQCY